MSQIVYTMLYSLILVWSLLYIWNKLLNKSINYKSIKLYITWIGITLVSIPNYFFVNKFIKIVCITIIFMFFFRFLFKEKIQKCIITPIYYQLIIMVSELLYALLLETILIRTPDVLLNSYFGSFMSNVIIAFISILIVYIKIVPYLYNKIIEITDKINYIYLLFFCMIAIIIGNILLATSYYQVNDIFILIINMIIVIICFFITMYSLKTQNKYLKVSDKYNVAINSLKANEDMMNKYKIMNHENKNLLLSIRAMVLNNEPDIPDYINKIVKNKYLDDEKLLYDLSVIPTGGLRATIYSEILKIKQNKLNYYLNIDRNINMQDFIDLDTDTIIDICKVLGVFIDNAIEAITPKISRIINICIYSEDKNLCIKVSNNYKGRIDLDKLSNPGYTTKDKGHGYGLSLVNEIITNNKNLLNITEVGKNIFSQTLIICNTNKSHHKM